MRTRLSSVVALSVAAAVLIVGASAAADGSTAAVGDTVTTVDETTAVAETSTTTTTTTTVPESTTTTVAEAAAPATAQLASAGTARAASTRNIDVPGIADAPAARSTPFSLTEPPPAPTTTVVPANTGSGKRIIYSKSLQWVWLVDHDETLVREYPVSGRRTYNQPSPGTYHVFSRSERAWSRASGGAVTMRFMIRFTTGPGGDNIGFHEIPTRGGAPLQSNNQLGEALSAGCVRQSTADSIFLWEWAPVGTKVVVLP